VRVPETPGAVPEKDRVWVPTGAEDETAIDTCCELPGVIVNVDGVAVSPVPVVVVTVIGPVKPLIPVAETETVAICPAATVRNEGVTVKVKSGGGAGSTIKVLVTVLTGAPLAGVKTNVTT